MSNTLAVLSSQTLVLMGIVLPAGAVIGHFNFISGTTAAVTPANWWMGLYDANRVQLAVSADQLTTAIGASTSFSLAVATIASGASATYTVPTSGRYYVGLMVNAGTVPTIFGVNGQAGPNNTPPILTGFSDTGQTAPPAFAHTAGAITGKQPMPYFWLT